MAAKKKEEEIFITECSIKHLSWGNHLALRC